ncbi:ATP-dependent helicase HrpB [Virgisporangium ochraceum]|uniref:ATP-dependent helicase n=1 Tax=Virgisporangium ochraceum TaxID=65505 RepID=A0A8J3ZXZ4_9ACTN|nr:ATP-dependent helicase HrpB [Virgisporangium ochraceum]GIJ72379.1 ATP-dependent helicase [Virgisporangium ochraceum]
MLPIEAVLPDLTAALSARGAAVLVSPPGTGKTTLVPLALAGDGRVPPAPAARGGGRVVVAEPRRVAARAAAARMAWLLGEKVGQRVGYTVRGERRVSAATEVEVVTTGVLVRRLLRDADLPGVATVVVDECHERHLDTDLAVAFCAEARSVLRPDLALLAMSATADAARVSAQLGGAPVIGADAPLFPVDVLFRPPAARVDPPRGLWVDPRLLDHVAAVTREAFADTDGDVLVFLPGAGELEAVARRLTGLDVARLHGRLGARDQDAVLRPADRRRVVLSTAVGESSLTVPGVRTVVDAGLARVPRLDLARGLGALVTVRVSRSVAHQRAGRAGREAPGRVYRCWSAADHDRLPAQPEPEIATADLTGFALALAEWGDPTGDGLPLLDPPPDAAMAVARRTLRDLDAVDDAGRVTDRGRRIAAAGVHPRLGRALLDGADLVGARRAAEVVAILAADAPAGGDDLAAVWRRLREGRDPASARWREETRRLTDGGGAGPTAVADDLAAGIVAGLAFPERLARRRSGGYLMAGGTAADLAPGSPLAGAAWLAIATAVRQAGAPSATVRLAAAIDEGTAREIGATLLSTADEVEWSDDDVLARRVERLGAVVLRERPLADPPPDAVAAALREGLRRVGLGLLSWTGDARRLRDRLAFCHAALGDDWPDVGDDALLSTVDTWLGPELLRARRRADLARADLAVALRRLLDHRQAARLDDLAPERLEVPTGSRVRLDYSDGTPVLAVKLQELFGWTASPRVGGGRVPVVVHLLSPAGRPLAVTADLESFWRNGYPAVRGEMRGRYPRHPWPADPLAAAPTRRLNPRRT